MAAVLSPIGGPFIVTARRRLPTARARLARSEVLAAARGRWCDETPEVTQRQEAAEALARATRRAKAGRP